MALSNPIDAYLQAAQVKERNRRQAMQDAMGIGQNIGGMADQIKKQLLQRKLTQMLGQMNAPAQPMQGPSLPGMGMSPAAKAPASGMGAASPPFNGVDQSQLFSVLGQLYPGLAEKLAVQKFGVGQKPNSPWRVVPGMMSGANPIQQNEMTGEVRTVPLNVTPTGRGNAAFGMGGVSWESATDQDKDLAKALYEGRVRPFDLGYRDRALGVKLANEYATKNGLPPFKSYAGDVAAGSAKAFGSGKFGQNALSLNTALGHVSSAYDAYQQIQNTDQKWLNRPINALKRETNDPNVVKLGVTLNALRGELATVFKGTGGTDQEIASWREYLTDDLTPAQVNSVIPQIDELLRSRLSALDYQRQFGMEGRNEAPLLSPKGAEISKRFGDKKKIPGQETKTLNGKTYVKRGTDWFEQ